MNKGLARKSFFIESMVCSNCEKVVTRQAVKVDGVKSCIADYATQKGEVVFDPHRTNINAIFRKIGEKGYTCTVIDNTKGRKGVAENKESNALMWIFIIIGILVAGYFVLKLADTVNLPEISQNMGYGLLFAVGLLTGFHCVAMCGGFVVSYTAKHAQEGTSSYQSHIMYGAGKTLSYTVIGAIFGLIGSIIAFTPTMRAVAGILAGIFLVLFGLKMLNIFPALRGIQFSTPDFIARFVGKESREHSSPLFIGLLNGLMIACGPLQAIYIMAAGTGSMIEGAKILFVFGLGTLPVMLGFGYFTSYLSNKMTQKILKASGIIVILLGLIMVNRGLALSGAGYDAGSIWSYINQPIILDSSANSGVSALDAGTGAQSNNIAIIKDGYQEIRMDVLNSGYSPNKFILKKGLPVKWIIDGKQVNGCNGAIQVPKLGLSFKVQQGEQTIDFTPAEEGTIPWSCWMGMLRGTFIVKDDVNFNNNADIQEELNTVQTPSGSTCGMGGGCGCGSR